MKRFHTGLIVLDTIDIICISFSVGSGIAFLIRKNRKSKKYKGSIVEDPIVNELKEKSPITMFSENGKPLKLPLYRGGDTRRIKAWSLWIKNKKLAILLKAVIEEKKKQKQLRLLQFCFFTLNTVLTTSVGLRFAVAGSLDYTQFILIAFPSTVGGLVMGLAIANPLVSVLVPLAILSGRGVKHVPNPFKKCQDLCIAAEKVHNQQFMIEMKKLNPLVEDASTALQLPLDKAHVLCVEEKLSLVERFKLKEVIKNKKARKRVQHFSEVIKKFPECDPDSKAVAEQIFEKIAE